MQSQRLADERKEALLGCCCYLAHSTQDLSCCNGSFCNVMQARVQGGTCPKIMAVPMEQTYKSVCVCVQLGGLPCQKQGLAQSLQERVCFRQKECT